MTIHELDLFNSFSKESERNAQMMSVIGDSTVPMAYRRWLLNVLRAKNEFMSRIARDCEVPKGFAVTEEVLAMLEKELL